MSTGIEERTAGPERSLLGFSAVDEVLPSTTICATTAGFRHVEPIRFLPEIDAKHIDNKTPLMWATYPGSGVHVARQWGRRQPEEQHRLDNPAPGVGGQGGRRQHGQSPPCSWSSGRSKVTRSSATWPPSRRTTKKMWFSSNYLLIVQ